MVLLALLIQAQQFSGQTKKQWTLCKATATSSTLQVLQLPHASAWMVEVVAGLVEESSHDLGSYHNHDRRAEVASVYVSLKKIIACCCYSHKLCSIWFNVMSLI